MIRSCRILVIGVGNRYRSDDAAGLLAADLLKSAQIQEVHVVTGITDGASMIDLWQGYEAVYVVDAVVSGEEPGKIYRFDAASGTVPKSFFNPYSTHSFSVAEAIQLAFALDKLPANLIVYGIEAKNFEQGEHVSPDVAAAVSVVAGKIIDETRVELNRVVERLR